MRSATQSVRTMVAGVHWRTSASRAGTFALASDVLRPANHCPASTPPAQRSARDVTPSVSTTAMAPYVPVSVSFGLSMSVCLSVSFCASTSSLPVLLCCFDLVLYSLCCCLFVCVCVCLSVCLCVFLSLCL